MASDARKGKRRPLERLDLDRDGFSISARVARHGELHRFARGELLVPGGEVAVPRGPIFAGVAEVEIAQRAADGDLADGERAAKLAARGLDLQRRQGAAHLAYLRVDPVLPLVFLRPLDLVAAADCVVEIVVAKLLLAQRATHPLA